MGKKKANDMSFLEHVEALRWHLIRAIIAIVIVAIAAFFFKKTIFHDVIFAPKTAEFITNKLLCDFGKLINLDGICINQVQYTLQNIEMTGQFMIHIKISLMVGLVLAFPIVFNEFWRFLKPALKKKEIKHSRGAVLSASMLFSVGALFGYFLIVPLSVNFLLNYHVSDDVSNLPNLASYIQTFTSVILASAVVFELPVLVYFLSKIGLVTPSFLKKYRKHSLVVILALSAIITPPDVFSQILVSLPLIILYEVGINISKRIEKKNLKRMSQELAET